MVLTSLAEIQGEQYAQPKIVVAEQVGGMEDIPEGVVGVLSASATDVLSHVAIRARNQGGFVGTVRVFIVSSRLNAFGRLDGREEGVVGVLSGGATNVKRPPSACSPLGLACPLDLPVSRTLVSENHPRFQLPPRASRI